MKLMIASDIHGSAYWCRKLMETIDAEQPDKILLLGDLLYHGPRNDLPKDYCPKEVIPMLSALKEKILAAKRAGINTIILSEENRKDIEEIKADYLEGLTFHFVNTNDEVLRLALK